MDAALLEKLNAYLISKGKTPKKLKQNFVKTNAVNVKRTSLNNKKRSCEDLSSHSSKKKLKLMKNIPKPFASIKENVPTSSKPSTPLKAQDLIIAERVKRLDKTKLFTHSNVLSSKRQPSPAIVAKQKLIRRSVNFCCNLPNKLSKSVVVSTNVQKPYVEKRSSTPRQNKTKKIPLTEKTVRNRTCVPDKKSITPKPRHVITEEQKLKRLEQLNAWLVAKGKDPSALRGFKPAKVVLTPVNSPAKKENLSMHSTQWPTLREEDYHDEMSMLVNQTMKEAQACLKNNWCVQDVLSHLNHFKEKAPVAEKHASFWITMSQVYQKLNRSERDVLSLFENALKCNAQPEIYIKEALKEYVETRVAKPETSEFHDNEVVVQTANDTENFVKSPDNRKPILQNNLNLSAYNQSKLTQRIIPISPLVSAESPSSIVKLRMVPKSSPIFQKIVSRKALPTEVNAIITPVRRSKRIENSKCSYPKGLLCPEKCISTPIELMKEIEIDQESSHDFVFDTNKALGDDYSDIQKVFHFYD